MIADTLTALMQGPQTIRDRRLNEAEAARTENM